MKGPSVVRRETRNPFVTCPQLTAPEKQENRKQETGSAARVNSENRKRRTQASSCLG